MEYCKVLELLDRLRSKFLKVDGGKTWAFMGVSEREREWCMNIVLLKHFALAEQ